MTSRPKPTPTHAASHHRDPRIKLFQRSSRNTPQVDGGHYDAEPKRETSDMENGGSRYNHNGHKVHKWVQPDGESGRRGVNPLKFFAICGRSSSKVSMVTNVLWPCKSFLPSLPRTSQLLHRLGIQSQGIAITRLCEVPSPGHRDARADRDRAVMIAAMVLHFNFPEHRLWIFITAYLGMVPCANLVGFAGQELARKLPTVFGVVLETTFGSLVEIILFMVLIRQPGLNNVRIIQAAILGSILANLLLCLGLCFFIGGIFHPEQTFHEAISEVGSNLMLVAGMGLVIPSIFFNSLDGNPYYSTEFLEARAIAISRAAAIILLLAFVVYMFFQIRSHHGLYEDILKHDEHIDHDREDDLRKDKLTLTESILAVVIGITFVTFMAVFLVQQIEVSSNI